MGCESERKSQVETVPIVSAQHKQSSQWKDKGCRHNLASKYIEHMPYVWECNSRLAVWSDVKEVLFPSCSDPECDIVLNALKIVSRYPWEDNKMQPCSPKQQMNFLRNFRLVPSGTLLVDLQFVKDKIEELWEMVWLKHGTSLDVSSRKCHYVTMQLTRCTDSTQSTSDRGPPEEQTNSQYRTGMHGFECKTKEDQGTLETHKRTTTSSEIEHNDDTDNQLSSDGLTDCNNDTGHQLDSDGLADCSLRTQQTLTDDTSDKEETFLEHRYPTVETMKILPRRDQGDTSVSGRKTKRNGYTIMPVVKPSDKDCDAQTYSSGAEISATFPQLHDYLDRLTSEFVVGHTDSSSYEIRRCTCIEGRCFTNWKIKRHGWNLPWQHMTSKDLLVSWDSVVKELQRLAGKAVDANDVIPLSSSYLDPFSYLFDESKTSFTNLISTGILNVEKRITLKNWEPEQLNSPARLYDLCKAQLQSCDTLNASPMLQLFRLGGKNVDSSINRQQEQRNAVLIPLLKVHDKPGASVMKKEGFIVRELKQNTIDTRSENISSDICVPTLKSCTKLNATNSTEHMVFNAKTEIHTSTPRPSILQKLGNVDKQPKKRQRIKSPTEKATLTLVETINGQNCLNKNQNSLDNNCSDTNNDGPTLTQLLAHPLPTERVSVAEQLSSVSGKYSSMNQNALYRNNDDTPQSANVFLRQMSGSSKQPVRRSNLFQHSASRPIDPVDSVPCLGSRSSHGETFHHLQKCASFPKKTFEKYRGVWDRISRASSEQSFDRKLNASSDPFKSCDRIVASTSKSSTKSKPQWNIDQIIKEHPRRIKGDSLYGISLNKAQARYDSQLQNTSNENATKTQCNKTYSANNKLLYSKSYVESQPRGTINEVLPSLVKPKTLMPPVPSVKRNEADKYQKKEVWYRNESVSRSNNYVHADTLLEMVSANPFNQTVESMMALRQYNCDIDLLHGSISNGTIGPRSSPLPKIDTDRVPTFLPNMAGSSDIDLCYQHLPYFPDQKQMTSESDSSEEFLSFKNKDGRNNARTSQCVQNERNMKSFPINSKLDNSIKGAKETSNRSKHSATFQTPDETGTSSQQNNKKETEQVVGNTLDELPRLSKSENCIKSKSFEKQNTSVCKSASSPGLPSSKYKVMVKDLTLTFTRLKDNNKKAKDDDGCHQQKQRSKGVKTVKERQPNSRVETPGKMNPVVTKTTAGQMSHDVQKQLSAKPTQKSKSDEKLVANISDKRSESSTLCKKQNNKATGCQIYDGDKITNTMKSKFKSDETNVGTDSDMTGIPRPAQHLHNKKRWLIEYQQNTSNAMERMNDDTQTTQHPGDLDGMVSLDSALHESLKSTVLEPELHTGNVIPCGSLVEEGYESNLISEDHIHETFPSGHESETLNGNVDVVGSLSRDTTFSEGTGLASPDEILLVDDNELGLIEEVVGNVVSVSMTDVTQQEENTQPLVADKDETTQETKNDLNMKTKNKVTTDSRVLRQR